MKIRNSALYLRFDIDGQLITPEHIFERTQAATYVYLAGFIGVELGKYVEINEDWINSVLESAESFRRTYISA